jgi:hypothetical protein
MRYEQRHMGWIFGKCDLTFLCDELLPSTELMIVFFHCIVTSRFGQKVSHLVTQCEQISVSSTGTLNG